LESLGKAGRVLSDLAKDIQAEKTLREELADNERTLRPEHPHILRSMWKLTRVLRSLRQIDEAEQLQQALLFLNEKVHGKSHPQTLSLRSELAESLGYLGRYAEAEELERKTLALKENVLGKQDLATLATVARLGELRWHQNEFEDALDFYERASTGYQEVLGSDHPITKKWLYYHDSLKTAFDEGGLKRKGAETVDIVSESTVIEPEPSNATGLALRPKEWWRPDRKKWKAGKETLHRWLREDHGKGDGKDK